MVKQFGNAKLQLQRMLLNTFDSAIIPLGIYTRKVIKQTFKSNK